LTYYAHASPIDSRVSCHHDGKKFSLSEYSDVASKRQRWLRAGIESMPAPGFAPVPGAAPRCCQWQVSSSQDYSAAPLDGEAVDPVTQTT
jgi:hypothetical protein